MTPMGFYFDQTRCTGCYTCLVACKDWYDINPKEVNYMRVSSIERGKFPDLFVAYLVSPCWHCAEPPCIKACPVEAISKRENDGIVVVDRDRCLGKDQCPEKCKKACPWDAPQFGPRRDAKMEKCQLCYERLEEEKKPVCVEACPLFALDAGPIGELQGKYGDIQEAEGFNFMKRFRPSVIFKPKKDRSYS